MRDQDKPFICYKKGWTVEITPRNAAGWRALGLWLLPLFALTGLFVWILARGERLGLDTSDLLLIAILGFLPAVAVWAITMIRWMVARAEIIEGE